MNAWEYTGRTVASVLLGIMWVLLYVAFLISLFHTYNKAARVFLYVLAVAGFIALSAGAVALEAQIDEPLKALRPSG